MYPFEVFTDSVFFSSKTGQLSTLKQKRKKATKNARIVKNAYSGSKMEICKVSS